MRLIFDLFPCQTASRLRGIGRYSLSLAKAMAASRGEHEMRLLANGLYPDSAAELRHAFGALVPPGALSSYTHPPLSADGSADPRQEAAASAVVQTAYQAVRADAVLCAGPFEGWCEQGMAAQPDPVLPPGLRVAVLYDLIPLLFPAQHLDPSPSYAAWYKRRLDMLRHVDLFLAISEATRADAIRLLDIPPERVVNIAGAADAYFQVLAERDVVDSAVRDLGITRPFVLYTGNGDYRKNLVGMLQAYARLAPELRRTHQLVVNQVGNVDRFREEVRAAGLAPDELVVTGRVDDATLRTLYNACTVFVFPSLYEGFGLPVLEAMQCGAPVIAGDNSSIPEVLGRDDALFDAGSPDSIAASLAKVLTDHAWRAELARHGLGRAVRFSWEETARRAWRAIEGALPRQPRVASGLRIAVVSAVKEATDGTRAVLAALEQHQAVSHFTPAVKPARLGGFDGVLYVAQAQSLSPDLVHLIRGAPGVLWLTAPAEAAGVAHSPDPALLLRDAGLQRLHAWLSSGVAPAPGRSLHEALSCLVLEDAGAAATLRRTHGLALPPLVLLDSADTTPDARATRLAGVLADARAQSPRSAAARIASSWRGRQPGPGEIEAAAAHAQSNLMSGRAPRLLIDVTQLARTDAQSGIQRVVRNIARELCLLDEALPPIELVQLHEGALRRANGIAASLLGHPVHAIPDAAIDIHPGDLLFMVDSSWEQYPEFIPVFDTVRRFGGRIVTVVYDLIPLHMPQFCSAGLVAVFQRWFGLAVKHSDMLLCISRAVRDDVARYVAEYGMQPPQRLQLEYWRLGADINPGVRDRTIRPEVAALAANTASPLFLMVGTIEPRKGHHTVLDAFDALWAQGSDARLVLAGKEGWEVDDLMQRIRRHPELNHRLFFVERFTDAEINLCYSRAQALLAASVAEGYGLPIVEAAQHRVPVIASDIPVFREVAGAGAEYFSLGNNEELMSLIKRFAALGIAERQAMADRVEILTWRDSALHAWQKISASYL